MSYVTAVLTEVLNAAGAPADTLAMERFEAYHRLLTGRNRLMDLSNVPDEEMPSRHLWLKR